MQVVEVDLLHMRRRSGSCLSYMVFRTITCGNLRQASVTQPTPLIWCMGWDLPYDVKIMALHHRQTSIPPLNCSCDLAAIERSSHTTTRWCWRLLSCVDLGNGIHFSHSVHWTLQFDAPTLVSIPELNPLIIYSVKSVALVPLPICNLIISAHSSLQHPAQRNMSQLCHRMCCRRGGNRKKYIHPPPPSPSTSTSPSSSPSSMLELVWLALYQRSKLFVHFKF